MKSQVKLNLNYWSIKKLVNSEFGSMDWVNLRVTNCATCQSLPLQLFKAIFDNVLLEHEELLFLLLSTWAAFLTLGGTQDLEVSLGTWDLN